MVSDLVLFPHCDLHIAMANTPQLTLKVFTRTDDAAAPGRYRLDPVTSPSITFMAPHVAKPGRFANLPTVSGTTITATALGLYLFVVQVGTQYQVGRLQVHHDISAWWFGNDSITTAVDPVLGHAQPSVYAKFSDDAGTGTDLVGDITGHGYVTLTSGDSSKVVVTPDGRLRGVAETIVTPDTPVNVSGAFRGQSASLPVRVVNYGKVRTDLAPVRISGLPDHADKHNMVFLAEGFRNTKADQDLFNEIVETAAKDLLEKPRHQPYSMLAGSFNIFKAFAPSQQHALTCGFRVSDTANADVRAGLPIPYNGKVNPDKKDIYGLDELIARVGLPMRDEQRPNLPALWASQDLHDFQQAKVDDQLVNAWKLQQSTGILHARDTFFGVSLGARWADRGSGIGDPLPALPNGDNSPPADVQKVVARMYEFYTKDFTRTVSPDPRRHPPELSADNATNPVNIIMNYLVNLQYQFTPNYPIGQDWFPDDVHFKPSRGLVALIANDGMLGGTNFNNLTITGQTLNDANSLNFQYSTPPGAPADKREMRRQPPDKIDADIGSVINTVAHEFGHSFNLADEYEDFGGPDPADTFTGDFTGDNVTHLNFIRLGVAPSTQIDPDKVKWLKLQRIRLSDRLLVPSTTDAGGIKVSIDPRHMAHWAEAQQSGAKVSVRVAQFTPTGRQLPLTGQLDNLTIRADINQAAGTFVLLGAPAPVPQLPAGALVFVPLTDASNSPLLVVEPKVLQFLHGPGTGADTPLNTDTDTAHVNQDTDHPVSIPGFKGPCKSARLVGIYEGAQHFAAGIYRPTGACKMRSKSAPDEGSEFCFVCKWLIVNRVDPGVHSTNDAHYYPKAKKNG